MTNSNLKINVISDRLEKQMSFSLDNKILLASNFAVLHYAV